MKIQVKRGLKADLKLLDQAEFGFCTDTKELFIGDGLKNIPLGVTGANGVGIEYRWNGTQLGIKREDETNYTYVELKGQKGDQGLQGIQGIPGAKGDKGDIGAQGIPGKNIEFVWNGTQLGVRQQGQTSYTYTNLQGEQGIQGPKGDKGDTGLQGPIGLTGATGANGFTWRPSIDLNGNLSWTNNGSTTTPTTVNIRGPQGIQGVKGDKGDTGERGLQGLQGIPGTKGADGLTTSVKLGSTQYNHSNGVISLPAYPTSLPANGGNSDTVDGIHANGFGRAYSSSYSFGGSSAAMTTVEFITLLSSLGAFNQPYWVARGSWSYAGNKYISDTGIGNIHLAGCTVEVIGNPSTYTIRIHTPTTSSAGVINTEYVYVNNGPTYSPAWRKIWNDKNDGSDSGLDADLLDGKHGSEFALTSHKHTKADITDFPSIPTKLSELQNDIGAGGGTNIVCSSAEPNIKEGEWWYKE